MAIFLWPSGCRSDALLCSAGLESFMQKPALRIALLFLLVVTFAALILAAKFAPPDGQDRSTTAQFFGRFHPLIVHLPIALLLLVPLLESAGFTKARSHLRASAG